MAKSTTGRSRFKIQRALGVELPGLGKAGALERRPYGPGAHGNKRKKISDYAVRMKEKQKLTFHYGLRESQLVNYIKKAKKVRDRAWIDVLLIDLERRLNNVVFRLNLAPSIPAASQMVRHGHVLINGKPVTVSSFLVEKGDVITLSETGYKTQNYLQARDNPRLSAVPACYKVDGSDLKKASMLDRPLPADVPFEFEPQLVIEHYWKVK
jgi:small subunit ribosomal protein S4